MWVSCHGSVILGYNQESEDPSEHYWIVLNSWGSIGKMKNSTYWLPMNINYSEKVELPTEFDNKGEMLRPARKSHRYLFYVVKKLELDLRPTVVSPPEILLATTEPRAGETLKLMASVVCTPPVTYQWFRNGLRLAGATQSVLVIPEATPDASGSYTVEATHSTGSVMSAVTTVTVNAPRKVESKTGDGRP